MKPNRREIPHAMRDDLNTLSRWTKVIVERWFKEDGKRHNKTIITFSADRFIVTEIDSRFRKMKVYPKKKEDKK